MGITTLRSSGHGVATDPVGQRPRSGGALGALRPILLALALFAAGMSGAVLLDYDPRGPLVPVGLQAVLAVGAAAIALLWNSRGRPQRWAADITAAAASAFPAVVLAVALHGSKYAVGGLGIAQANRTPAVARYMETWHLVDYSYQGLPAFYPPLMPWVVGRIAAFVDATPYHALKLASIGMLFAAPLLAYLLWRRLLPAPVAAFVSVAVAGLVAITPSAIRQPDSFLALCVIVPWWLDAIFGLRRSNARPWPFWVHGVIGALVFCLYYYFFFPLALSLLLLPLLRRWHGHRVTSRYRDAALVLATAAALSAVYWLRFLISWISAREPVSLQNLWFTDSYTELHVDLFDWTPITVVMLVGVAHVAFTARRDRLSAGLLFLLAAGYAWYVLGFVLAVAQQPVLVFRTEQFVELLMLAAGVRAAAALLTWAVNHLPTNTRLRPRDATRAATVLVFALVFVLGQNVTFWTLDGKYVQQSHDTPLPNGELQPYASDDVNPPDVSINKLETVVRTMNNHRQGQPVVLSTSDELLKVSGMYAFNQWHAIYAHPAGEFRARVDFLERLEDVKNPDRFAEMARHNRFDPIDVMVLKVDENELVYDANGIDFPTGFTDITVTFSRDQLGDAHWETRRVGPYVVAAAS